MKVESLRLQNLTVFKDARFEFCGGINVLVGANATGKSHALKALYSVLSMWPRDELGTSEDAKRVFVLAVLDRLREVFGFHGSWDDHPLKSRLFSDNEYEIETSYSNNELNPCCGEHNTLRLCFRNQRVVTRSHLHPGISPTLFIPPREFLAAFEGFVAAYEKRELSFDQTYKSLCIALSGTQLKPSSGQWSTRLIKRIEELLGGTVTFDGRRFSVGDCEAHLLAEGHRKLAMILQLLRNGGIEQNTTLFWDEPESGLNPILIKEIADLLIVLAEAGLQIFIATHDYLLTNALSLMAEYHQTTADIRFFCLHRADVNSPVNVEHGDLLTDLEHEPIINEFSKMYDREMAMFHNSATPAVVSGVR